MTNGSRKQSYKKGRKASGAAAPSPHHEHGPARLERQVEEFLAHRLLPYWKHVAATLGLVALLILAAAASMGVQRARARRAFAALDNAATAEAFDKVAKEYPGTPAAQLALLRAAREKLLAGDASGARAAFEAFLKEHPDSVLKSRARLGVAYALEAEGKLLEAEKTFLDVARTAPDKETVAEAYVGAGRCAFEFGKLAEARKHYENALATGVEGYFRRRAQDALETIKAREAAARLASAKAPPAGTKAPAARPAAKSPPTGKPAAPAKASGAADKTEPDGAR